MAARNFVGSVLRDVELPDVLVSDRDTRFAGAFWTGLRAAPGVARPRLATTTSVNGVIADVLRSFAGERADGAGGVRDQRRTQPRP